MPQRKLWTIGWPKCVIERVWDGGDFFGVMEFGQKFMGFGLGKHDLAGSFPACLSNFSVEFLNGSKSMNGDHISITRFKKLCNRILKMIKGTFCQRWSEKQGFCDFIVLVPKQRVIMHFWIVGGTFGQFGPWKCQRTVLMAKLCPLQSQRSRI